MTTDLPSPQGNGVRLIGTRGSLLVDLPGQRLRLRHPDGTSELPSVPADEKADWRVEAEFVGAIRGQEAVRFTDFATGVRYMAFTDAVHRAAASGQRVAIEPGRATPPA